MKLSIFFVFAVLILSCEYEVKKDYDIHNAPGTSEANLKRQIIDTILTENGQVYELKEYFEGGSLSRHYFMNEKSQYHLEFLEYYEDGTLRVSAKFFHGLKVGMHAFFRSDGTREVVERYNILHLNEQRTAVSSVLSTQTFFDDKDKIIDSLTRDFTEVYELKETSGAEHDSVYIRFRIMESETKNSKYLLCLGDFDLWFLDYQNDIDSCIEIEPGQLLSFPVLDSKSKRFLAILYGIQKGEVGQDSIETFVYSFPRVKESINWSQIKY